MRKDKVLLPSKLINVSFLLNEVKTWAWVYLCELQYQ